jgi:hypothetical protein
MFNWVYELSTGILLFGGPCEVDYDTQTQGLIVLKENPSPIRHRVNEKGELRAATAQEISDYGAAQVTKQTADRFDNEQLVKALAIWTAQKLGIPLATARQEILTILRGL